MSKRMTLPNRFAYVASAPWSLQAFRAGASELTGEWILIESRTALTSAGLREFGPRYVFFPHWSWHVPDEVVDEFECVCFHMTDLPYGRGATPLQNLILRRHKETKLTALRMVRDYDAGPVYMKRSLSLEGSAKQIYQRAAEIIIFMMREIIERNRVPLRKSGRQQSLNAESRTRAVSLRKGRLSTCTTSFGCWMLRVIRMLSWTGGSTAFISRMRELNTRN